MVYETPQSSYFLTDDGVRLHYVEQSQHSHAPILVLLPGWSQTSKSFLPHLEYFSHTHRTIFLDPRGHGQSDKPSHGYRLSRFARDVFNLVDHVTGNNNEKVTLLGHSASVGVIYNFIELFGQERLNSIVLVDQMVVYLKKPGFSNKECLSYGAQATADDMVDFLYELGGPDGEEITNGFLRGMFSDELADDVYEEILAESLLFPRDAAAKYAWDVMSADFRDVLKTIKVPALCIGGSESHIPPECLEYMASEIPNGRVKILPGTHFMFIEHPDEFNTEVSSFLKELQSNT